MLPRIVGAVVRLALPPRCPGCGAVTADDHRFCADCWGSLVFLGPPWCAACARPFVVERGAGAVCGRCVAEPPVHGGARAAVAYGPVARTVALRLKYARRTALADTAARAMLRVLPDDVDALVPVPLHRWRLWRRGYNQAALIAEALGRAAGRPVLGDVLHRIRATPSQRGQGRAGRRRMVRGAFAVRGHAGVAGRHLALVDDVYTTGATAEACAAALLAAGVGRVTVICWARVLEGGGDD